MAIELKFQKLDNVPWGFRLTGGSDYDHPLTVLKVADGSPANVAGLEAGDVIVRVNDIPTANLTHTQVHDVIQAAGNQFTIAVRRDTAPNLISAKPDSPYDEQDNLEVSNILGNLVSKSETPELYDTENVSLDIRNAIDSTKTGFIQVEITIKDQQETTVYEEQSQSATIDTGEHVTKSEISEERNFQVHTENINDGSKSSEERKWSTFLQKPKCPKPKPKIKEEPKGETYRVIIKKQKKAVNPVVQETESVTDSNIQEAENPTPKDTIQATEDEQVEKVNEEQMLKEYEEEIDVRIETQETEEVYVEAESAAETEEVVQKMISESSINIEEQLAEVQKQLQALSQLPSTIQETLDAVSQQLAKIVSKSVPQKQNEEREKRENDGASEDENVVEPGTDTDSIIEDLTTAAEDEGLKEGDISNEDCCEDSEAKQTTEGEEESSQQDHIDDKPVEEEPEIDAAEQEKVNKLQQELFQLEEHHQRRLEQRPTFPLTPLQRPIILPGGRRWSQPDDACPTVRRPKLSDEKIADTIETFSEVLVGHTKGESNCFMVPSKVAATKKINFLKYQLPPKKFDFLQKSEVYRLVHDMEPPIQGIARRASKILSAQDYYGKE